MNEMSTIMRRVGEGGEMIKSFMAHPQMYKILSLPPPSNA